MMPRGCVSWGPPPVRVTVGAADAYPHLRTAISSNWTILAAVGRQVDQAGHPSLADTSRLDQLGTDVAVHPDSHIVPSIERESARPRGR